MAKVKEMRLSVQTLLILMLSNMGMDTPENIEEITDFVFEDVQETADPNNWHSGDVAIAFRRWIEAQVKPQPKEFNDALYGVVNPERSQLQEDVPDNQCTKDFMNELKSGFNSMYTKPIEEIIRLGNLSPIELQRELQNSNSKYHKTKDSVEHKQSVTDSLIELIKEDLLNGDCTVLDELLMLLPLETLIQAHPEEYWSALRSYIPFSQPLNIWSEIRSDYEHNGLIHIDAWISGDDNENGYVIAKVNIENNEVTYFDERAKTDKYAQEVITECFNRL